MMDYRRLGRSDLDVSVVGFGCWAMGLHGWPGVTDADSVEAVHRALDLGITLFDTADVYGFGHSERTLAQALGAHRYKVVIATKGGVRWDDAGRTRKDISPRALRDALRESLRRLGTEQIPLYQVHWPDGRTPLEEAAGELQRCREDGLIRWFGFCNVSGAEITALGSFEALASCQTGVNPLETTAAGPVLDACRAGQVGVLAYSPLAQGMFSGGFRAEASLAADDVRRRSPYYQSNVIEANARLAREFAVIAGEIGVTPSQLTTRWVLSRPGVTSVLSGVRTASQIAENSAAVSISLTAEVVARLDDLIRAHFQRPITAPP